MAPDTDILDPARDRTAVRTHLLFGWWSIFGFGLLGLGLETLHGLKIPLYLDVANETRRLMWTLAHAHGTLLGLVHIAFAFTLRTGSAIGPERRRLVSRCLMGATVALPGGFFLGGVRFYAGDPGLGVVLVPVGAALLLLGAWQVTRGLRTTGPGVTEPAPPVARGRKR